MNFNLYYYPYRHLAIVHKPRRTATRRCPSWGALFCSPAAQ